MVDRQSDREMRWSEEAWELFERFLRAGGQAGVGWEWQEGRA